jgi:hypothetical protein
MVTKILSKLNLNIGAFQKEYVNNFTSTQKSESYFNGKLIVLEKVKRYFKERKIWCILLQQVEVKVWFQRY